MMAGLFGGVSRAFALEGSGTQASPYKITSEDDWKQFCIIVNEQNSLDSWAVLTADIDVNVSTASDLYQKMVGRPVPSGSSGLSYHSYKGTFDGHGHTLFFYFSKSALNGQSSDVGKYIAPFGFVRGATIKNLKVDGSMTVPSSGNSNNDKQNKFAAGIVGSASDNTIIQNCISSVTLNSEIPGDGSHGGIVGLVNSYSTVTIKDCIFNGRLLGSSTNNCSGFVGAGYNLTSSKCIISNCLFAPEEITMSTQGAATFSRCAGTISNSYYKTSFGATNDQGTNASSMSADDLVTALNSGATSGNDSWMMHNNQYYLKPFEHYVDITGWVSGFSANPPVIKGNHSTNSIIYAYYSDDGVYSLGYDPPTNPGHYRVSATIAPGYTADGDYWYGWNDIMKFCVVNAPTGATLSYNYNAQTLLTNGGSAAVGTFYYKLGTDGEWSTSFPTATEAGDYKVYYYVKGDASHNDIISDSYFVPVTIAAKTVNSESGNLKIELPATMTYTGSALTPTVTVKDGDIVIDPSEYTVSFSNNVNVGDSPVTVTITDKTGGNYTVNGTAQFTIVKAAPTYTAPTAKDLTYNMNVQELINPGGTSHGTFEYSSDGTTFTTVTTGFVGTEAKDYLIYYRLIGDSNHNDVGNDPNPPLTLTVKIKPKPVTTPGLEILLSPDTYYYDGTAKTPSVTVRDEGTVISSTEYTVDYGNNINAGTVTVTLKDNPDGNYTVSGTQTFTILPQVPTVTPPTAISGLIYNTKAQNLLLAGTAVGGTVEYSSDGTNYSTTIPQGTDAKQYPVYYRVKGDINHTDRDPVQLYVTISPKTVSSPTINLDPSSFTYDGTEKKPAVTVKDGETVISASEYAVEYSNNVNVGTAMVIITDNTGGNYIVNGSANFTILSANSGITPPTAKTDLVYNGESQELVTEGSATGGTMYYGLSRSSFSTVVPTGKEAKKYTVYYKVVGDNNHEDSEISSVDVTIAPKTLSSPEIILTPSTFIYDGTSKEPAVTVKDGDAIVPAAEYTIAYSDNKNVGTGTVTITDNEGGNYVVNGTAHFAITNADANVTPPTAKTGLIYNTQPQQLVNLGTVVGGTMEYSLDGKTFSTDAPMGTDAQQYTVYYRVKGDENHGDSDPSSLTVTISPKTVSNPVITLSATVFTFDGKEKKPGVSVKDGEVDIPESEYTVEYSDNINVGTAMVTVKDQEGGNYIVNGTSTFRIIAAGAGVTLPVAKTGLVYNGMAQELVTAGSADGGTMKYSLDSYSFTTEIPTGTNAKDYVVYYKVEGDANHEDSDVGSLEVTISPKTLSPPEIILNPSSYIYDGTAKQPAVTVKDGDAIVPAAEYTIAYSDNKNVGTGTVTITDNEGGNYVVNGTAHFAITNADANVTPPTAKTGLIYNTQPQQLVNLGTVVGGTMEYSLDGKTFSTDAPMGTDAQQYTVYYRVKGDENHGDSDPSSLTVTISPKTVSNPVITLSATVFTFDGKEKKPGVSVKDGEVDIPESEYTVEYSDNINVGTAMVTVKDQEGGNYIVNGTSTFRIIAAGAGVTLPVAKTGLVYNGMAQELVTAGSADGGTMKYSLDSHSFTTEIPTGTDAKDYIVYFKVTGDANHEDSDIGKIEVTISSKTLMSPEIILNPSSFTYDGTAKEPTVTVKDGDAIVPASEYTVSYSDNTNVGTATVSLKDNDGGNYIVSGTAHFSIVSVMPGVTPPTAMTGLIYNTKAQQLVTSGSVVGGTMEYSLDNKAYSKDVPTGTDAKEYTVFYRVKGDENHGDRDPSSLTVTISPKTVSNPIITLSTTAYVYDGKEHKPDVTVKDGEVEVPASEYTVDYSDNISVGTAMAIVKDKEGGNYIVNGTKNFTIVNANADVTPPTAKTDLVYNGTAQQLISAGKVKGGTMEYSLDNNAYTVEIPTGLEAKDYKVYYRVKGDANYSDEDASSLTVTISPKTVTEPNIVLDPASFVYDGKEKKPSVTVKDGDTVIPVSEYSVSYSDNTAAGTATVTITDNEGGNYTVSGSANFSIVAAVAGVTLPEAKSDLIYNRTEQELVIPGSADGGTMEYSLNNKKYSTKVPTGTNAKQYTVYFRVVGDDNHVSMDPKSLTVTINAKSLASPVIELSEVLFTYDGTEKKPGVTVKDEDVEVPASEYTVEYSDNINVGTAMVIVTDKDGGNYIVNGTKNFNIVVAGTGVVPPTAKTGLVYNGAAQQLVTAGSAKGGTMVYSLDNNTYAKEIPTGTDAKQYTVYYKVEGDDNHSDSDFGSVDVTISPKTVSEPTIILEPASFVYDGVEKKPAVTVMDGETEIPTSEYTVSYSDNTTAGTATVTITDNDGGNYTVSGMAYFSIITAVTGVTLPTAISGLVYNGYAQELIVAGSTVGGTMEYSLDNNNYSTKVPTGTDAKQYNVYFKVIGDANHASKDPVMLTVTISSKSLTSPTIELNPSHFVYNGQAKEPTVTVKDGEMVVPASEYTVSYSNNVNVGTATVTIKDNPGGNYVVSTTATFQIYDPNTGFVAPVGISGLIYNGKAQELVLAGTGVGGVMKYSLDDKNYSTLIPTATDAGNYKVYYKVVNEENNVERNTGSVKVTISPKTIILSITLRGAPESVPSITVVDGQGNLLSSYDYSTVITDKDGKVVTPQGNRLEVGDYVLTVTPIGNYTGPSVSVSFHVRRAYSFVFTMTSDIIGVCLPFDRDVPKGYHVYYFDRVGDDGYPVFKRILLNKMNGGEPYLLRYVGSSAVRGETRSPKTIDLTPSNLGLIDISMPIKSQTNQNMVFTGTFDDMTRTKAQTEGAYLLQRDGSWKPINSGGKGDDVCLEAFLAYIRMKDRTTPSAMLKTRLVATNGEPEPDPIPMAINALILEDEDGHQEWYDMQGRRLEAPQKGVNILRTEDGKTRKVVVR